MREEERKAGGLAVMLSVRRIVLGRVEEKKQGGWKSRVQGDQRAGIPSSCSRDAIFVESIEEGRQGVIVAHSMEILSERARTHAKFEQLPFSNMVAEDLRKKITKLTCAQSCKCGIKSGSAEQHSHTEVLRVRQFARRCFTSASSATIFVRDRPAKSTSSVLVRV